MTWREHAIVIGGFSRGFELARMPCRACMRVSEEKGLMECIQKGDDSIWLWVELTFFSYHSIISGFICFLFLPQRFFRISPSTATFPNGTRPKSPLWNLVSRSARAWVGGDGGMHESGWWRKKGLMRICCESLLSFLATVLYQGSFAFFCCVECECERTLPFILATAFSTATAFNSVLSNWDTSNVVDMFHGKLIRVAGNDLT